MKRSYVTPVIAVEHYNLTQSIAACDINIGFLNSECVKKDTDATPEMISLAWSNYFMADNCKRVPTIGVDSNDGVCYHTNTNAAFSS